MTLISNKGRFKGENSYTVMDLCGQRDINSVLDQSPECLVDSLNVLLKDKGKLITRSGTKALFKDVNVDGFVWSSASFTLPSTGIEYLGYIRGNSFYVIYRDSIGAIQITSPVTLASGASYYGICAFNNQGFVITDGSSTLRYWSPGGGLVNITYPSGYGNPIQVREFNRRVMLLTSNNYFLYTFPFTFDVWEERAQILGTGSITSGTSSLTGTNTLFLETRITVGTKLLLVSGSSSAYFEVAVDPTTNTAITTRLPAGSTFTNANIFIVGQTYFNEIPIESGSVAVNFEPYGDHIAVAATPVPTTSNFNRGAFDLIDFQVTPSTVEGSAALDFFSKKLNFKRKFFPFAMVPYLSTCLIFCPDAIFAISGNVSNDNQKRVIDLSFDPKTRLNKFSNLFPDFGLSDLFRVRAGLLTTENEFYMVIGYPEKGAAFNSTSLFFYDKGEYQLEATKVKLTTGGTQESPSFNFSSFGTWNGEMVFFGPQSINSYPLEFQDLDAVLNGDNIVTADRDLGVPGADRDFVGYPLPSPFSSLKFDASQLSSRANVDFQWKIMFGNLIPGGQGVSGSVHKYRIFYTRSNGLFLFDSNIKIGIYSYQQSGAKGLVRPYSFDIPTIRNTGEEAELLYQPHASLFSNAGRMDRGHLYLEGSGPYRLQLNGYGLEYKLDAMR